MPGHEGVESYRRVDFLLVLRFFAAVFVIVDHVFIALPRPAYDAVLSVGPYDVSWFLNSCGQSGVFLFFCLSGYLMGKGFARERYALSPRGAAAFLHNRLLRIGPSYAVYILLVLVVTRPNMGDPNTLRALEQLFTFRYNGLNEALGYAAHLWTISTEVQFYLLVPLLMVVLQGIRPPGGRLALFMVAGVLLAGLAAREIAWRQAMGDFSIWYAKLYVPLAFNLDLFCAGILMNYVPKVRIFASYRTHLFRFLGTIFVMYTVCTYVTHFGLSVDVVLEDTFVVALPAITAMFALPLIWYSESMVVPNSRAPRIARMLEFGGTLTFGIYLWQAFVPWSRSWVTGPPLCAFALHLVLAVTITTLLARAMYYSVEVPLERFRANQRPLRKAAPA